MRSQSATKAYATSTWDRLSELSRQAPEAPCISFQAGETHSRSEVLCVAKAVAGGLRARGVTPGDRVGTMVGNRVEFVATWLACLRLGAILVPLNVAMQGDILTHMLATVAPVVVVTEPQLAGVLRSALGASSDCQWIIEVGGAAQSLSGPEHLAWDSILKAGAMEETFEWRDEPASILFTSGTTGPSKGVTWTEGTALALARGATLVAEYSEDDVSYVSLPLLHANGLYVSLLPAMLAGSHSVVDSRFSASNFWSRICETGATLTSMLGIMAPLLARRPASELERRHSLRRVLIVPCPRDTKAFEHRFGVRVRTFYALTDSGMPIGVVGAGPFPDSSCGRELPDWECALVDSRDLPVARGEVGELVLRPRVPGIGSPGYWKNPEATLSARRNLWFHTGDLMSQDVDGWFYFQDRTKDAIRKSGENISSYEVERVLESHPSVCEVAVYAVPSEFIEDEVMASVVLRGGDDLAEDQLAEFCRSRLPYFAVPRFILFCAELPKTSTQKIEKQALRERGRTTQTVDVGSTRRTGAAMDNIDGSTVRETR